MSLVLIYAELSGGKIKKGAFELLSFAQKSQLKSKVLVVGPGSEKCADQLKGWSVEELIHCEDPHLENYNSELYLSLLCDVIKNESPDFVLASASMSAKDLFPRAAARLGVGIVSDCTDLQLDGSNLKTTKPMYAGKCFATTEFKNSKPAIALVRPNQLSVGSPNGDQVPSAKSVPAPSTASLKTLIKDIVKSTSEKLDLTEANIIVSGGRGMKGPEHFKLLEDLAETLGATVGASRAVVDAGWVPHAMQVGQTGKTVAPSLYIACGISGAIQHLAGMSGSKVIVAINNDKDAPIFQKATYGIVGDVFEILPELNKEFKELLN